MEEVGWLVLRNFSHSRVGRQILFKVFLCPLYFLKTGGLIRDLIRFRIFMCISIFWWGKNLPQVWCMHLLHLIRRHMLSRCSASGCAKIDQVDLGVVSLAPFYKLPIEFSPNCCSSHWWTCLDPWVHWRLQNNEYQILSLKEALERRISGLFVKFKSSVSPPSLLLSLPSAHTKLRQVYCGRRMVFTSSPFPT